MVLNAAVTPIEFLQRASECRGEVFMISSEGDKLNLKSQLSKYLFVSVYNRAEVFCKCHILCELPEDEALLAPYWQKEEV